MASAAGRRALLLIVRAWVEDGPALRVRLTEVVDRETRVEHVATIEEVERIVRDRLTELLAERQTGRW